MGSLEEIRNYEEQIVLLEAKIAEESSEDLIEMLNDLKELTSLLREELGDSIPSTSEIKKEEELDEEEEDEESNEFDDLIGNRVLAPYKEGSQAIQLHSAIILDIEEGDTGFLARVLFSAPLTQAMKPCNFFLKDSCRFEANCKFSHGHLVPLEELEEYKEPDFSLLKEDALVLVATDKSLWDVGRITVMDLFQKESAVKLLKSGKEISSPNSGLIPLAEEIRFEKDEPIRQANTSWLELKGERLGEVTVGELGNWTGGGFGLKMLQKMGYQLGQGLGKNNDGIVHAVQAKIYPKGKGLDNSQGEAATKLKKKRKRRQVKVGKILIEEENEIFSFINRRLAGETKNEAEKEAEDRKKMKQSTESSLGTQNLTLEMEIKKMRANEKKLIEGINRNSKSDPKTAAKMQQRLEALRKDIAKMERRYGNVASEQSDRRQKKKEIF